MCDGTLKARILTEQFHMHHVGSQYQLQMMRCLREVNVDDNSVGWYQSTSMGNFMNQSLIEHQFEFQQALNKSVLIIHGKQ